jgi:hypothetical protein
MSVSYDVVQKILPKNEGDVMMGGTVCPSDHHQFSSFHSLLDNTNTGTRHSYTVSRSFALRVVLLCTLETRRV